MRYDDIEPLEPRMWLLQVKKLAAQTPVDETLLAVSLRRAFYLVQLTPRPLRHIIRCAVTEPEFERLLEENMLLAAAVALVGDLDYRLTPLRGEARTEARLCFPGETLSRREVGVSAPLALFAAWLQCLRSLYEPDAFGQAWVKSPGRRKSQSGQRPKLTEH